MSSHPPPAPPAGRSSNGRGKPGAIDKDRDPAQPKRQQVEDGQRQQAAVKQNTTHPGYQQDR